MASIDFAVIGGGIVGTSAAAALSEAGAGVAVYEREDLAAAASGRNSGAIQHPVDEQLAGLYRGTLELYERLEAEETGFALPREWRPLLLLSEDRAVLLETAEGLRAAAPELDPTLLEGAELAAEEPALAEGLAACRLSTAIPVPPASATRAFGEVARRTGVAIETGVAARPWVDGGRARGVVANGARVEAGAVLVAAGPETPGLAGLRLDPPVIVPVWGVNVEVGLAAPPVHALEQLGLTGPAPGGDPAGTPGELLSLFSLVTADGASSLGSTFLADEPDAAAIGPELVRRGAAFVPALAGSPIRSTRACARPQSVDGRPLVGRAPQVERLFVAAGHGPWGISIGPASARLVADLMLGRADGVPPALDPARFA
jgi:D-amino-acid dehydrogenase